MSEPLQVLCAGAVKGVVEALQAASPGAVVARFGAVGAMREALRAGSPCDVLVVTDAMATDLEASGELVAGSRRAVGRVQTGVAVPAGAARPAIDSAEALRHSLLAASALYFPDAERSTAGAHVVAVLDRLGLDDASRPHRCMFANGATAMRALADSGDPAALGCTQVTEIVYTAGIDLVGALPGELALATVYSAAVATGASNAEGGRRFIERLCGAGSGALRSAGGFDA